MIFFSLYLGKRQKPRGKFAKPFLLFSENTWFFAEIRLLLGWRPFFLGRLENFLGDLFLGEHLRLESLDLGLGLEKSVLGLGLGFFFVLLTLVSSISVLGLEGCVLVSTSGSCLLRPFSSKNLLLIFLCLCLLLLKAKATSAKHSSSLLEEVMLLHARTFRKGFQRNNISTFKNNTW